MDNIPGIGQPRKAIDASELNKLLLELRDLNPKVRVKSAIQLGDYQDVRVISPLVGRLTNDASQEVRVAASTALFKIGNPLAWDVFAERLISIQSKSREYSYSSTTSYEYVEPSPDIRAKIAEFLGLIGDPKYAEPLTKALIDPENIVRNQAAVSIGKLKNKSVIPILTKGLSETGEEFQKAHVDALVAMGPIVIEDVISSTQTYKKEAESNLKDPFFSNRSVVLGKIGLEALPSIEKHLDSKDKKIRRVTIGSLYYIKSEKACSILCKVCISEESQILREFAINGLRNHPSEQITPTLISILKKEPQENLRILAALILGEAKSKIAVEPLCETVETDKSIKVRNQAILSLKQIADERAIPTLGNILLDAQYPEVRKLAAEAIGAHRSPNGINYLCVALGNDIDLTVKESSLEGLLSINDPKSSECIRNVIINSDENQWKFIIEKLRQKKYLSYLLPLVNSNAKENLRVFIVNQLGGNLSEDPSILSMFTTLLKNESSEKVKVAIVNSLYYCKDSKVVDWFIYLLANDKSPEVRLSCIEALRNNGDRRAVGELRKASRDSNPKVKQAADEAIRKIERGY